MVRRVNDEGFRWLEPPYTTEEQQMLGGRPPLPEHVTAETYSVSVGAADERYRDDVWSEFSRMAPSRMRSSTPRTAADAALRRHDFELLRRNWKVPPLGCRCAPLE
jgi:hypothetical protein